MKRFSDAARSLRRVAAQYRAARFGAGTRGRERFAQRGASFSSPRELRKVMGFGSVNQASVNNKARLFRRDSVSAVPQLVGNASEYFDPD